jgi:hypothetical protein
MAVANACSGDNPSRKLRENSPPSMASRTKALSLSDPCTQQNQITIHIYSHLQKKPNSTENKTPYEFVEKKSKGNKGKGWHLIIRTPSFCIFGYHIPQLRYSP